MSKLIRSWDELRELPNESSTHILTVDKYSAWLNSKEEKTYDRNKDWYEQLPGLDVYLSTHTFYDGQNEHFTKVLQLCGFDVVLANWDDIQRRDLND